MKLVIERARWLRGTGGPNSKLLDRDGKMCCLGFFGLACGFVEADLRGVAEPSGVTCDADGEWPSWLSSLDEYERRLIDTTACGLLMGTNDDDAIDDRNREEKLAKLFAEHGVEVEFV